ncbi:peroxidase [Mycobacterium fragae]|nr:peroxidase [Mycobacterium fragae]
MSRQPRLISLAAYDPVYTKLSHVVASKLVPSENATHEAVPQRSKPNGIPVNENGSGTLSRLVSWIAEKLDRSIGWSRLPTPLAIPVLIGLRQQLRAHNLYDTGRGAGDKPPYDAELVGDLTARSLNGTHNDLDHPLMGSLGSRFGRNVPLAHTYPEEDERLLDPNPRLISRKLLVREGFQPATTLNLLAAAWIQFEVHDWFSHGTDLSHQWEIPLDDDDPWPNRSRRSKRPAGKHVMRIERTPPDPSPDSQGPPTFVTRDTHWWDSSQIYGGAPNLEFAKALRLGRRGQLRIDDLGLPPEDAEQTLDLNGTAGAFWVGLAILHSLFMREHNAICERLAAEYPHMSDQQLYDKARLVNCALMAKIHTVDWTPAVIAHPTTVVALRANWFGVLGERFRKYFGRITKDEVLQGIPGSPTNQHGVPYSLTEEFVAVYRMHPLIPDHFVFRSVADNKLIAEHELPDLTVRHVRDRLNELKMDDIFYSFGRAYPGAINLHNFPRHLQYFKRYDDSVVDLAAIDILRARERGVPRYNEFRRLLRLKPASSFEELTDNPQWAAELRRIYGDVERVDLMIGLYAEPKPPGFGFSDTAFRIFILMASRRLESDRFFTRDYRPEIYTPAGMDWIDSNTMRTVLLRHFPSLEPALRGVKNPFAPWARVDRR